jgi:O-antigen ligase
LVIPILLIGGVVWLLEPDRKEILRQPAVFMPLLAGAILIVTSAITGTSLLHIVAPLIFGHMYFTGGLVALFRRLDTRINLTTVGLLGLLGSAGGAAITSFDVLVLHAERGGLVNNPLRMALLTLPLGFVALIGVWRRSRIPRAIFILGPIFALATVYFTGSRGPALAALVMVAIAVSSACYIGLERRKAIYAHLVIGLLVGLSTAALFVVATYTRVPVLSDVIAAFRGDGSADFSTIQRLNMYEAAYHAFLASPWFGHGLIGYVAIAESYALPGKDFVNYDSLHNDLANAAVVAGIPGIVAYFLFVCAPLGSAMRNIGSGRGPVLYLALVTTTGYVMLGVTDTTVGVHWQNVVLTVISSIVALFSMPFPANQRPPKLTKNRSGFFV